MATNEKTAYVNLLGTTIHVVVGNEGGTVQTFEVDGPELTVIYDWEDSRDGLSRDARWRYSSPYPEWQKNVRYIVSRDVALLNERPDFVYPDGRCDGGPDGEPCYTWLVCLF